MKKPKRINSVSVGLLVIAVLTAYLAWAFLPVFWPLWRMTGIMRATCARAIREPDDKQLMKELLRAGRRTNLRVSENNFILEREPYSEDELLETSNVARREQMREIGKACVLRFRYVSSYELPLFGTEYRLPYESNVNLSLVRSTKRGKKLSDFFYNCTCTSVGPRG